MTQRDSAREDAATLETAPTCFVEGRGIRFAYRRLGPSVGIPLVLLQHFSGNIDAWDPAVVNALAADRPVIAFDNAGVGRSTGRTPDTVEAMARDAVDFIGLLGLVEVDLLGFSLGGCVAQQIAAEHGRLVRKLILAGTAPKGGEEHLLAVLKEAFSQADAPDLRLPLFFTPSSASQSAGLAVLARTRVRQDDRDTDNGSAVTDPQAKALITWCATPDPDHALLRSIHQPTLVAGGSDDTMLPSNNAYSLFKALGNAQLILYPDSGHGAPFQHHEMFVSHVRTFLDGQPAAKVTIDRLRLKSSKAFDAVVAALKSAVGQPDMVEFFKATKAAKSFPELERIVQSGLGRTGFMMFAEFDLGAHLRRESGSATPNTIRFLVGNPLIMKDMVKHVPDAGSYAPVTILIDERPDGVHLSYDRMESFLLPYGNAEALAVARALDAKVTALLRDCAL